jgi:hypothetical protein
MRREEKRRCGGGVQRSPCWSFSLVFSFLISFCVEGFSRIYFYFISARMGCVVVSDCKIFLSRGCV